MKKQSTIIIPPIPIEIQPIWEELIEKYRSNVVIINGGLNFTETYWYLGHTRNNSTLLHSVCSHLYAEIGNYENDYSYRLLKSVVLEGFFSLRESLARLVNVVYGLPEVELKSGASSKILEAAQSRNLIVTDYLSELIPKNSKLGIYLEKYRHPYVHREDLSRISIQDYTAGMIGKEQPRVTEFITESHKTSRWMQEIESHIVKECATYF